jgi:hypothetical protein
MSETLATVLVVLAVVGAFALTMRVAVGQLRRGLDGGIARLRDGQEAETRRLVEAVARQRRAQQDADARIEALVRANRRLAAEVAALKARRGGSGDDDADRVLH